jgi:hypothetical protein
MWSQEKPNILYEKLPTCAALANHRGDKTREGGKSVVTRLQRMKHGSGVKDRDDKSSGIEIRMSDALPKINPTDPLTLSKQAARRNLNCSDSSGIMSLIRQSRGFTVSVQKQ